MKNVFLDISYLNMGNIKQKKAYKVLTKSNIFSILKVYNPILAGTIPIGIDVDKSDLDIICEVYDFKNFSKIVEDNFGNERGFKLEVITLNKMVVNFYIDDFEIEIYAENKRTIEQNAYRHMIIEDRILKIGGEILKNNIIKLKRSGLKTEPSFAKLLGLEGNPYMELFIIENMSDNEIKELIGGKNEERNNKCK